MTAPATSNRFRLFVWMQVCLCMMDCIGLWQILWFIHSFIRSSCPPALIGIATTEASRADKSTAEFQTKRHMHHSVATSCADSGPVSPLNNACSLD